MSTIAEMLVIAKSEAAFTDLPGASQTAVDALLDTSLAALDLTVLEIDESVANAVIVQADRLAARVLMLGEDLVDRAEFLAHHICMGRVRIELDPFSLFQNP